MSGFPVVGIAACMITLSIGYEAPWIPDEELLRCMKPPRLVEGDRTRRNHYNPRGTAFCTRPGLAVRHRNPSVFGLDGIILDIVMSEAKRNSIYSICNLNYHIRMRYCPELQENQI